MTIEAAVADTMIKLVARVCAVPPQDLSPDTMLDEVGVDSLSLSQIMAEMEAAFSIELWDEDIAGLAEARSIGDFVGVLNAALGRTAETC
ncbi:acyl carrier protein [Tahibacter sp.]|uniref:acyl carrier protein n=1 Tax=Tahibacter sp. TaxID=2056211 RepID=UPI0028C3F1DB|nr:acyl carrier protein [Tahibacter sp.]